MTPDFDQPGAEIEVDQTRLDGGDIDEAYSADHISNGKPIRKPFAHGGHTWVCVGMGSFSSGAYRKDATAYRLTPFELFQGEPFSYGDAKPDGKWRGYHGMRVLFRGRPYVLVGPPAQFIPRIDAPKDEQMGFDFS